MKKAFVIICIIFCFILAYITGFTAGIQHTIQDSKVYQEDNCILIEIDNNTYVHYAE